MIVDARAGCTRLPINIGILWNSFLSPPIRRLSGLVIVSAEVS